MRRRRGGRLVPGPRRLDGLLPALFKKLCLFESFYGFLDGVFDWTALCLLVSVCAVFTVLTVQSLEKRRWSE